jgi:hypothetical protein
MILTDTYFYDLAPIIRNSAYRTESHARDNELALALTAARGGSLTRDRRVADPVHCEHVAGIVRSRQ